MIYILLKERDGSHLAISMTSGLVRIPCVPTVTCLPMCRYVRFLRRTQNDITRKRAYIEAIHSDVKWIDDNARLPPVSVIEPVLIIADDDKL